MAEVNLAEIKFGVAVGDRLTGKLNSPPNFPAIRQPEILARSIFGDLVKKIHVIGCI